MKKLKIGYIPYSNDLTHPADRRRLLFWANSRGHEVITDLDSTHDVLLVSECADIVQLTRRGRKVPLIFDLIDGYLESPPYIEDSARGLIKFATGQLSGLPKRYSKAIQEFCQSVDAVICSTPEQRSNIIQFNSKVHDILDFHEEFPLNSTPIALRLNQIARVFWEGLPFTLPNLFIIEKVIGNLKTVNPLHFAIVTDLNYPRLLGKYLSIDTQQYLNKTFPELAKASKILRWNIPNMINESSNSNLGILPISLQHPLNQYKAENRLLIMWRLGLPVLASPTKAYERVLGSIGGFGLCWDDQDWQDGFDNFGDNLAHYRDQVVKGQDYLASYHSKDVLLNKWDAAFESVLP